MQKKTLILGGGVGGIVASTVLKKIMKENMDVTVIDKNSKHYFAASFPFLMIDKRKPEEITRELSRLEKKGINFVNAEITSLDFSNQIVTTTGGNFNYDYLIICPGVEFHPETVPGFKEYVFNAYLFDDVIKLRNRIKEFSKGHIVFFISSLPYKCPPAPYEIMFLIDQYFIKKGFRDNIKLTIVTPEISPESLAGPRVGQSLRKQLSDRKINLITEAKILSVEKNCLVLDHGNKIEGDLLLGIPSNWTPDFLRKTDLVDATGWVEVNQKTLETKYPNVYAVGDCTKIKLPVIGAHAPKAGIFAHYQAEVAARNIALKAKGKEPIYIQEKVLE